MAGEWHGGPCSIGLPIKKGTTEGWITAGHCVGGGDYTITTSDDDVDQPFSTSAEIGKATQLVHTDDCDCAFIEKNSADSYFEKRIWFAADTYTTIIWFTDRISDGSSVIMTGAISGPKLGIVSDNTSTHVEGSISFDVIELTTDISQNGDSGAPYTNTAKNNFYGTHKGDHYTSGNSIFIPWVNIETQLGL